MKKTNKISTMLLGVVVSLLLLACMQNVPDVKAQLYYYDNNTSEWKLFDDNVFEKKYLYGQKFVYTVTDSDESKFQFEKNTTVPVKDGNVTITKRYKFNKEQWSLSSSLDNQEIFDGTFEYGNNNLYAYYTVEEVSSPVRWSWQLFDAASIAFDANGEIEDGNGNYNVSYNINSTYYNGKPIAGDSVSEFYDYNENEREPLSRIPEIFAYGMQIDDKEIPKIPKNIKAKIKGNTRRVTIPGTLTRHGYKLLGWSTDCTSVIPEYPPESSFELQYKDGYVGALSDSNITSLFAIWERDTESGWWELKDLSNNGKFTPVFFERYKGTDSTESASEFEDYPYYKEVLIPAKGYYIYAHECMNISEIAYAMLDNDFAIGEYQFTGHMLNQLRAWNESTENKLYGFEKYELPEPFTEENAKKEEEDAVNDPNSVHDPQRPCVSQNIVSYGLTGVKGNVELNKVSNSRNADGGTVNIYSDNRWYPISYLTIPQAMVICNAMTEYYNSMNQSTERLTYAYAIEGGDRDKVRVRTIKEAESLIAQQVQKAKSLPTEGFGLGYGADKTATGFRLPTQREWEFAALTIANNLWLKDNYALYSYPQLQKDDVVSGYLNTPHTTPEGYAVFGTNGTIGFKKENNKSINSYGANGIGIKGMNGNLNEWVEDLNTWVSANGKGNYIKALGGAYIEQRGDVVNNDAKKNTIFWITTSNEVIDQTGVINWDSEETLAGEGVGIIQSPKEGKVTAGLRLVRTLK